MKFGRKETAGLVVSSTAAATEVATYRLGLDGSGQAVKEASRPFFNTVSAAPSTLGSHGSILTAFDGDLSKVAFAVKHMVTGTATLSQPTSGYVYTPEATPHYTYLFNSSGWNDGTADNVGRTAATAYRTNVYQAGQGDCMAYNAAAYVTGTRSGSTKFLANPAASLFTGNITGGADGVYLNPYETAANDGGFDVACFGAVYNLTRTIATGAKSVIWGGTRYQSLGAAAVDNIISATGKFNVGIDFAMAGLDFGTNKAAIALKAGQRIYLNNTAVASGSTDADWKSTTFGNTYLDYDSATSRIRILVNGGAAATFHGTNAVDFALGVNVASGKTYAVNGQQVVAGRDTGWAAMTGSGNKATVYDTSAVTLAQLAGRVMSMQAALMTHGLLGT
jgi:hypothetical protein